MRFILWNTLMCGILALSGVAQARELGSKAESAKLEKSLRIALVITLSEDLDLNEQQTVDLLRSFIKHNSVISSLRQQQAQLREDLLKAGTTAGTKLDELIQVDQQLRQSEADAAQQVGASLTADQRAKVYLLLSTMDEHVESILGDRLVRERKSRASEAQVDTPVPAVASPTAQAGPKQAVAESLEAWAEGVKAADLDKMMAAYSETFNHYEYGNKAGVHDFLKNAIDMGYLEGIQVSVKDAEIEVKDAEATAFPVELSGNFGQGTIEFSLRNEEGVWRIVGMELSGV